MLRSTSTDRARGRRRAPCWPLLGALGLLAGGAAPLPAQGNEEVAAALRAARRAGLPVLWLAADEGVLEVRVDDLVLQRLPVRRLTLLRAVGAPSDEGSSDEPSGLRPPAVAWVASLPIGSDPTPPEVTADGRPAEPEAATAARGEIHYRVPLDVEPHLLITEHPLSRLPERSWRTRISDGWLALRGHAPERHDLLVVEMASDDARRIHHLFRPGVPIVVESAVPVDR